MLATRELVEMRAEIDRTLPGTAVIHTRTTATDGQGGYVQTFAASSTVDARLSPEGLRGMEGELAGRVAEVSPWILTLPAETSIVETSRVVYGSQTFEVVEVMSRTPWELSKRVRLMEVD